MVNKMPRSYTIAEYEAMTINTNLGPMLLGDAVKTEGCVLLSTNTNEPVMKELLCFHDTYGFYDTVKYELYDDRLLKVDEEIYFSRAHCEFILAENAVRSDELDSWLDKTKSNVHVCSLSGKYGTTSNMCKVFMLEDGQPVEKYVIEALMRADSNSEWAGQFTRSDRNGSWYHNDIPLLTCECCGTRYVIADGHDEDFCSEHCYRQQTRLWKMGYHTDVLQVKGWGDSAFFVQGKKVHMGIELECMAHGDKSSIRALNKFGRSDDNNYCIPTADGSLDDYKGVEYVFKPSDFKGYERYLTHFIGACGDYLEEDATESDDGNTYGLHIHVSNHFMRQLDKAKIALFVNNHSDFFADIGGRNCSGYCRKQEYGKITSRKVTTENYSLHRERYNMVNLCNEKTIEFRFPKSIVSKEHILANMQLVYAVSMFCTFNTTINRIGSDRLLIREFVAYIVKNKTLFNYLVANEAFLAYAISHGFEKALAKKVRKTATA